LPADRLAFSWLQASESVKATRYKPALPVQGTSATGLSAHYAHDFGHRPLT